MSIGKFTDKPHKTEAIVNNNVESTNNRTSPKRRANQPVMGSIIAWLTAKEVMTHVPLSALTAKSPAIVGIATLAIETSSTFMKMPSDNDKVMSARRLPFRGGKSVIHLLQRETCLVN